MPMDTYKYFPNCRDKLVIRLVELQCAEVKPCLFPELLTEPDEILENTGSEFVDEACCKDTVDG